MVRVVVKPSSKPTTSSGSGRWSRSSTAGISSSIPSAYRQPKRTTGSSAPGRAVPWETEVWEYSWNPGAHFGSSLSTIRSTEMRSILTPSKGSVPPSAKPRPIGSEGGHLDGCGRAGLLRRNGPPVLSRDGSRRLGPGPGCSPSAFSPSRSSARQRRSRWRWPRPHVGLRYRYRS